MKEIHITPVLNGFIVNVGCQTVVFDSIEVLCSELKRYQKDPVGVEKEYYAKAVNPAIQEGPDFRIMVGMDNYINTQAVGGPTPPVEREGDLNPTR